MSKIILMFCCTCAVCILLYYAAYEKSFQAQCIPYKTLSRASWSNKSGHGRPRLRKCGILQPILLPFAICRKVDASSVLKRDTEMDRSSETLKCFDGASWDAYYVRLPEPCVKKHCLDHSHGYFTYLHIQYAVYTQSKRYDNNIINFNRWLTSTNDVAQNGQGAVVW